MSSEPSAPSSAQEGDAPVTGPPRSSEGGRHGRPPRAHALELVLDPVADEAVRRRWALLEETGVRSLARHTGATHRPHLTLVSGPPPDGEVLDLAARACAPLLPVALPVAGQVLLGSLARATLAELVAAPADLVALRARLAAGWAGADERPWVPHLTLALRLDPGRAALSLARLAQEPTRPLVRRAVALRWWDPETQVVTTLAGEDPAG